MVQLLLIIVFINHNYSTKASHFPFFLTFAWMLICTLDYDKFCAIFSWGIYVAYIYSVINKTRYIWWKRSCELLDHRCLIYILILFFFLSILSSTLITTWTTFYVIFSSANLGEINYIQINYTNGLITAIEF